MLVQGEMGKDGERGQARRLFTACVKHLASCKPLKHAPHIHSSFLRVAQHVQKLHELQCVTGVKCKPALNNHNGLTVATR